MSDQNTPMGEYNRWRAHIQLGDGTDQRGDATFEMVREPQEERRETAVRLPAGVELKGGENVIQGVPVSDKHFAEFYLEMMRTREALIEGLGLDFPEIEPKEVKDDD